MNRYCLTLLLFIPWLLSAQKYIDSNDPDEIKSLLGKGNDITGFGQADLKLGDLLGNRTLLVGAQGGIIVNRRFILGLGGYGIATENQFDGIIPGGGTEERPLDLYGGYGGVVIGFTLFTRELIHLHVPVLMGAGSFDVVDNNFFFSGDTDFTVESSVFYVVEPVVQLEFNITEHFRIAAGTSYRYIQGTDLVNLTDDEVTDYTGTLTLRFGRF